MKEIDLNDDNYYIGNSPEKKIRTHNRLQDIKNLGLKDLGDMSFGIKDLMSGLYLEMVWSFNGEEWLNYTNWITELKKNHDTLYI